MRAFTIIILSFLGLFCPDLCAQQPVYIEAHEMGRGILKARSSECFMITPAHVVQSETRPFQIWGVRSTLFKGELQDIYQPDLAIVRIVEGGSQNCESWEVDQDYVSILTGSVDGFLEIAQRSGSIQSMKVFISGKDNTLITIRPYFPDEKIIKGMSGSSLFTLNNGKKKIFLGMLVSIENPTTGFVLPANVMDNVLSSFFTESTKAISKTKLTEVAVIALPKNSMDAFELAQKASDILAKQYPKYSFVPYEEGKLPVNKVICEVSEITETDSENRIDRAIYKYKSRVILTVRNNGQLISRETLNGGGTDYSKENAQSLSVVRTLETTDKLKFEK